MKTAPRSMNTELSICFEVNTAVIAKPNNSPTPSHTSTSITIDHTDQSFFTAQTISPSPTPVKIPPTSDKILNCERVIAPTAKSVVEAKLSTL